MSLEKLGSQSSVKSDEAKKDENNIDSSQPSASSVPLIQRVAIVQKDEKGYGLTVSGDNPVYVQSVKPDGAAAKAGVQKGDRIIKLAAIHHMIGYPGEVKNNTAIEETYKDLQVHEGNAMKTYIDFLKRDVVLGLKLLRKKTDRSKWTESAATVNADYNEVTNTITFPAAILQPPFYTKSQPNYLNYGGIGSVIGHEITHGFDDSGRRHNKDGKMEEWWTEGMVTKFKERAKCITDQYNNFTVVEINMNVNGERTQDENIADNGGVKVAFRAYKKWVSKHGSENKLPGLTYSQEELFFINFAQTYCENARAQEKILRLRTDEHSTGKFRVIGSLQNFAEFSDVFRCPVGSYMNPKEKCTVW